MTWTRPLVIPGTFATGSYRIVVGLYNTSTGSRLALAPGNYVSELSAGSRSYVASYLTVTNRTIRNASFSCGDIYTPEVTWPIVTTALNADLAAIVSGTSSTLGEIYKLPQGGCRYETNLFLTSKTNIEVVGAGVMDTTLLATSPQYPMDPTAKALNSALKISTGNKVRVRDFSLRAYPNPVFYECTDEANRVAQRSGAPTATGILIDRGPNISVERTRIGPVFNSGIFFGAVNGGNATANEIYDTLSDGIHVTVSIDSNNTTPSANIVVNDNVAKNTGDDSFASVGKRQNSVDVVMQGTQIKDNRSTDSCKSGVTVEGTIGGTSGATVSGNLVTRSGMAGIRVASDAHWGSPAATSVTVTGNTLDSVRTRCDQFHPALLVGSDYRAVSGILVSGNTIRNPRSPWGIAFIPSSPGTVSNVTATNNAFVANINHLPCSDGSSTNLSQAACVVSVPPVPNSTVSGNTYNGTACP